MLARLRELVRKDDGQDLVEYAMLALFVVLVGVVLWHSIEGAIFGAYQGYDSGVQELWEPCDPGVKYPC